MEGDPGPLYYFIPELDRDENSTHSIIRLKYARKTIKSEPSTCQQLLATIKILSPKEFNTENRRL